MKVICDVHISRKVVGFFQSQGVEAIHVNDILEGSETKDYLIAGYADQHGFVVISKDADFKNDHLIKGSPKRLLKINLGNIPNAQLIRILGKSLDLFREKYQKEKCLIELSRDSLVILE